MNNSAAKQGGEGRETEDRIYTKCQSEATETNKLGVHPKRGH